MGLMQLLTVGHTVMGIKDAPSPYRVFKQNWLPKFGSTPALSGTCGESGSANITTAANPATASERCLGKSPGACQITPSSRPVRTAEVNKIPFYCRMMSLRSARRYQAPLRQAELSLDTVAVVRNDLRDSDIEVVRSRKKPGTTQVVAKAGPERRQRQNEPVELGFETLGSRLMKAGKMMLI